MRTILFIENEQLIYETFVNALILGTPRGNETPKVLWAQTLEEAETLFDGHREELDLIVVDGMLDSDECDTEDLVRCMREKGYSGPMAANSFQYNEVLQRAGCSHSFDKNDVANLALEILF